MAQDWTFQNLLAALKAPRTKEETLKVLQLAGILDKNGKLIEPDEHWGILGKPRK